MLHVSSFMTRVKRGVTVRRKHKKLLERTKGYRMTNNRLIKRAHEADLHAGVYAFAGRKKRKRDMRQLWISRISQSLKLRDLSYNRFIASLKEHKVDLNRKILAVLSSEYPKIFDKVIETVVKK